MYLVLQHCFAQITFCQFARKKKKEKKNDTNVKREREREREQKRNDGKVHMFDDLGHEVRRRIEKNHAELPFH